MSGETTSEPIVLRPIGIIHTAFREAAGTPIQPRFAGGSKGRVEVFRPYAPALKDLDGFERVWLLYWLHAAGAPKLLVRPYMDTTERGLFATRAPSRFNPIGLSPVRLLGMKGNILHIEDVDILDGTPLLDIKPYCPKFDCFEAARSGWLDRCNETRRTADDRFHGGSI